MLQGITVRLDLKTFVGHLCNIWQIMEMGRMNARKETARPRNSNLVLMNVSVRVFSGWVTVKKRRLEWHVWLNYFTHYIPLLCTDSSNTHRYIICEDDDTHRYGCELNKRYDTHLSFFLALIHSCHSQFSQPLPPQFSQPPPHNPFQSSHKHYRSLK